MPQKVERFAEDENKAKWVIDSQNSATSPIDTAIFCDFCLDFGFSSEVIERLMREATGMDGNYADMVKVGERNINVERLFNIREGYTRKDDSLPGRFLEPLSDGQPKGQTFDAGRMLDSYY
jgi:aldehyde:ferredoxin oxidoreductase